MAKKILSITKNGDIKPSIIVYIITFLIIIYSCNNNPNENDSKAILDPQNIEELKTPKEIPAKLTRNEIIEIVFKEFKTASQLSKIKKIDSEINDVSDIIVDDFDNDSILDVIVFSSGFFQEGGNMAIYSFTFFTLENNKLVLKDEVSSSDDIEIINSIDKKIYFKTKRHSDDDPQCCPSLIQKNSLSISNNGLFKFSKKLNRV